MEMTVKWLKEAINSLPDDMIVFIEQTKDISFDPNVPHSNKTNATMIILPSDYETPKPHLIISDCVLKKLSNDHNEIGDGGFGTLNSKTIK